MRGDEPIRARWPSLAGRGASGSGNPTELGRPARLSRRTNRARVPATLRVRLRHVTPRAALGAIALTLAVGHARGATAAPDPHLRWCDDTPDAMIEDAAARALAPHASTGAELAAIATMGALSYRAED